MQVSYTSRSTYQTFFLSSALLDRPDMHLKSFRVKFVFRDWDFEDVAELGTVDVLGGTGRVAGQDVLSTGQ